MSNHAGDGLSSEPDFIITDDNVVHVTWQDTGTTTSSPSNEDSDIFYLRLTENGSSFAAIESEPILVSNNPIDDAAGRANPDNARSISPQLRLPMIRFISRGKIPHRQLSQILTAIFLSILSKMASFRSSHQRSILRQPEAPQVRNRSHSCRLKMAESC